MTAPRPVPTLPVSSTRPHRGRAAAAAVLFAFVLSLSACGGSDQSAASGDTSAGGGERESGATDSVDVPRSAGITGDLSAQSAQDEGSTAPSGRVAPMTQQVIKTAKASVVCDDVAMAEEDLELLVARLGGSIAESRSTRDPEGGFAEATILARVPSGQFEQLVDALADLGLVTGLSREAVDVTTDVIDVDARIRTAEISLRRLRAFLDEAGTADALVRLESEIARREAELSSLRGQSDYLADQAALSTVKVSFLRERPAAAAEPEESGFVAGLKRGWDALGTVVVGLATVAGALLPFAVAAALALSPMVLLARWLRRRPARSTVAAPGTPAAPPA